MKVCGIIAEFNPFHRGHEYIIKTTRKQTGADYIIVAMSGDYVQRGEPAILDKHFRSKIALSCGADLVLEIPGLAATGSAEYFARGSVALFNALGVVDILFFGSESGNLSDATPMANGHLSPNDLLSAEYQKALHYFSSSITPMTTKRVGHGYHDADAENGKFCSATHLRDVLLKNEDLSLQKNKMPDASYTVLTEAQKCCSFLSFSDFSLLLYQKLLELQPSGYENYFDIFSDLSNKIRSNLPDFQNADAFRMLLKSKDIAYTHISRGLLHILLDYTKEDVDFYVQNGYLSYLRLLGFSEKATTLLSEIKKNCALPLISKPADAGKLLSAAAYNLFEKDVRASHLYQMVAKKDKNACIPSEYRRSPIIL